MLTLNKEQLEAIQKCNTENLDHVVIESTDLSTLHITLWYLDGHYSHYKINQDGRRKNA